MSHTDKICKTLYFEFFFQKNLYIEKTETISEVKEQSEAAYWGDQFEDIVAK